MIVHKSAYNSDDNSVSFCSRNSNDAILHVSIIKQNVFSIFVKMVSNTFVDCGLHDKPFPTTASRTEKLQPP